ncbi:MAG: hypothetical protein ACU0BS_00140 [Hasllibacter sp.]
MRRVWNITRGVGREALWVLGLVSITVLTALAGEAALTLVFG